MTEYTTGKLAEALAAAQGKMTAAKLDGANPHFKSRYATLASIWDSIREPLSANGLAVVQTTETDDGGNLFLRTTLMHASGESITSLYPVQPAGRMADSPQGYGSALTYARRYSLAAMVGVVADEDDDGNAASQPQRTNGRKPATQPAKHEPEPGEDVWSDERKAKAIAWAMNSYPGTFKARQHAENAFAKMVRENPDLGNGELRDAWITEVRKRFKEAQAEAAGVADDDEQPGFNLDD